MISHRLYTKFVPALLVCIFICTGSAADGQTKNAGVPEHTKKSDGRTIPLLTIFGSAEGPKFKTRQAPQYPFAAKKRLQEGTVVLRLSIDEIGLVRSIEVAEATAPVFIDAAVASVKGSTFRPATTNRRPVASQAILPIHFKLKTK